MKAMRQVTIQPDCAGRLEQAVGAHDIAFNKCIGATDRAIDVALSRKMHNGVQLLFGQQRRYLCLVADVGVHKLKAGVMVQLRQVGPITRIGQRVIGNHKILRVGTQPVVHKISTDKAGRAGNQQSVAHSAFSSVSILRNCACHGSCELPSNAVVAPQSSTLYAGRCKGKNRR